MPPENDNIYRMRALVVGGNGFMGSHLVDQLVVSGWEVAVLDAKERSYEPAPPQVRLIKGDLGQSRLVTEALTGVDIVFHLAWSTIHESSMGDPIADLTDNVIPSILLIQACLEAGTQRIVYVSSGGTVYEPTEHMPIPETHAQNPISAYGITKLAVEKYLQMFRHSHGIEYAILRPSVPYGPRQNPLRRQGAVAVFLYQVAHGLPVTIWGDGSTTRDYFYISDLVEALIAAAERELDQNRVFNVGGSQEVSLIQLVGLVEQTVGQKARIEYKPARKFDARRIVLDTRLASRELGWRPNVSLEQGLAQTWEWLSSATVRRFLAH